MYILVVHMIYVKQHFIDNILNYFKNQKRWYLYKSIHTYIYIYIYIHHICYDFCCIIVYLIVL